MTIPCFPACNPWCDCVGGQCVPSAITINAVRLRTADGRFLQAANGGGGLMVATGLPAPGPAETFSFVPPTSWPLVSGAAIALDVFSSGWSPSGLRVRVDHNIFYLPPRPRSDRLVSYEVGGPGAAVFVNAGFPAGYPAYPGDDPAERIFSVVKMSGGAPVPVGTLINSGDQVVLRVDSNRGKIFFFRVVSGQSDAEVHGDGTSAGQAGTIFTAEFNEVRSGLGWRPPAPINCQSCATVTATVSRAPAGTRPIPGTSVVAQFPGNPYQGSTGSDGRATLLDALGRNCIPAGAVQLTASANRHKTKTVTAAVPAAGAVEVPIQLDCTQVAGKVIDGAGSGVPGAPVFLRDADRNLLIDEDGNPYSTTTAADGRFVFNCVQHGYVQVWTTADPSQIQHTRVIGPDGWPNVTIVIQQATCGNLVGRVIDADTRQPIAGAVVTESGGGQTTTDANGEFRFQCVRPSGSNTVFASAAGYAPGFRLGTVPSAGNSVPVVIELRRVKAMCIQIRLDWGLQPSDLDSHLAGPDSAGGRFHCFFVNLNPVGHVELNVDDVNGQGPETIEIRRTPATAAGTFVPGEYHYWVHNFTGGSTGSTFSGSGASVSISAVDALGNLTQLARYDVVNAIGNPVDDLWHVTNLTIAADGTVTRADVQAIQAGNSATVL
jgi:uncharacterized protein YfaP (DUF2135 family)